MDDVLKDKFHLLVRNKFVRNVAVVASGTAGAQAIAMAFSPLITRIYGPEAFGIVGVFMALIAMLSPVIALSYPIAIVLPQKDLDAKGIVKLSLNISFVLALLFTAAILIAGDRLMALVKAEAVSAFVLLIPLTILFEAWLQIIRQWLIRKKRFQIIAKIAIVQALALGSAKTAIGWFNPIAATLIILTAIGSALHASMLYLCVKNTKKGNDITVQSQSVTPLLKLAKRYYDFPLYRTPQVFINAISQALPVLLLATFFGPASAGFYAICRRVLGLPSNLIGGAVGDVFYPRIAEAAHRGENLTDLVLKATLVLAAIGFFPFAIIIAFGPWLFGFVFGSEWTLAGEYARWLSFMLFFNFIIRPVIATIPVLGLQKGLMIYELFSTGTKIFALYIGFYLFKNDVLSVAIFSIFGTVSYFILIVWVIFSSKYSYRNDGIN